jgi:hypothetical protein
MQKDCQRNFCDQQWHFYHRPLRRTVVLFQLYGAKTLPLIYGTALVINFHMIGEPLLKKLNKLYEPSALINLKFKSYDLAIKTDEDGNPILLFIGKADKEGKIKGDRYARRLLKDHAGKIIKDHWDHKGKV